MLKRRKMRTATATNMRMFCLRPLFIVLYLYVTIFLFLSLVDECVFFWVCVNDGVIMNPDLDNIPSGTISLLGEPETGKFDDDITRLTWLNHLKVDLLLLCIEHLGHLNAVGGHLTILDTRGIGTLHNIL